MVRHNAFTLIEILIVIVILGVIATIIIVAIDPMNVLAKTRNSRRVSTLKQLQTATEEYFAATGKYPRPDGNTICTYNGVSLYGESSISDPDFMPSLFDAGIIRQDIFIKLLPT